MAGEDLASYGMAAAQGAGAGSAFGPWGMAAGATIGLGLQLFGMNERQEAAAKQQKAQEEMIRIQQQEDALRQQQMHMQGQRNLIQVARNVQQASALSLQRATNQGAGAGSNSSGEAGGQAQIRSYGALNSLTINQNLMAGDQMFALKRQLAEQQIAYSQAGGQLNTGSGLMSLGGSVMNMLPYARNVFAGGQPTSPGPYEPPTSTV